MRRLPLGSLALANLVPLPGIYLLDWDLFSVLFFYWLESGIVGLYNIPRMWMAKSSSQGSRPGPAPRSHRTSGTIFFLIHYSGFMTGHGFFIFVMLSPVSISLTTVIMGVAALTLSHGVSFAVNFVGHREFERVTFAEQMVAPYRRIVTMHIAIIATGFLLSLIGQPSITLAILVLLKIVIDFIAHRREHQGLGAYARTSAPLARMRRSRIG